MSTLDLLLKADKSKFKRPTKEFKVKRLSEQLGEEVIFTIQSLGLDKLEELRETNSKELNVHSILNGVIYPNLKDKALLEKFEALTPVDLIKKLLLSGEIEDLYNAISKLSGYGLDTIEELKKK